MALDAVEKEDLEAELLKLEEENRLVLFLCVTGMLDLPQVDCENAKANDSQDDESEGRALSLLSDHQCSGNGL